MITDSIPKINSQVAVACEYAAAGLSVIPLRLDGSKAPAISSWQKYQTRIADQREIERWFSRPAGIGIVAGAVSGGLEILDFDDGSLFEPFRKIVESIVIWLPVVETPSGGYHVLYRCGEIGGNSKIAKDPSKDSRREKQTLIETRGEGGYVAAVGSAAGVHNQGPYVQVAGPDILFTPTIEPGQRRELFRAARSFDRRSEAEREKLVRKYQPRPAVHASDTHPAIVWFNEQHSWAQVLEPAGWQCLDGQRWSRPGREGFKSAEIGYAKDGAEILTVYSANAGALAPTSSYISWNKFEAWKRLYHSGDGRVAFREAAAMFKQSNPVDISGISQRMEARQ